LRAVSPVDVTRAVFDEFSSIDPLLRAFCEPRAEAALYAAHASEQRWHDRAPLSALVGVPVSIKDHIDVAGFLAPARGGPAKSVESSFDSPVAARLREAGAVIVGKTTMPELSVIRVTQAPSWGTTRNPLNPDHSLGGSSGGAAAAFAAGLCAIAIGSDGGGSIRLPAAFTGTVGHKPTLGLVPYFPGQTDRTVAGPMSRSYRDIALAMDVIACPDGRDWLNNPTRPRAMATHWIARCRRCGSVSVPISATCVAPSIGDFYPDGTVSSQANRNLIGNAAPFNHVHVPAISIPCGTVNGLPVGLQLGGRRFSDAVLIALAENLEHMSWSEPLRVH
jgi:Asp-tRNA(Asn)/Glu-tRNA(Gln) amidotransferase A subunit family amidase